jgi:hypothetical protein
VQFGAFIRRELADRKVAVQRLLDSIAHRFNHLMEEAVRFGRETSGARRKSHWKVVANHAPHPLR